MYIVKAAILIVLLGKKMGGELKSQVSSWKTKPKNSNGSSKIDKKW